MDEIRIIFSVNNKSVIKELPYVPPNITISSTQKNEEFQTANGGTLNMIGKMGLKELVIESVFFNNRYNWMAEDANIDGWSYVDFFETYRKEQIPIRCYISEGAREILNIPCTIESFSYTIKKNKDIKYSMSIKEYRFAGVKS